MVLIIKSYHLKSNRIKGKITMIKIQHIEDIKKIRNIEKTVKGISNIPLFDISTWNSGEQYKH